jgi:hypothetical protein
MPVTTEQYDQLKIDKLRHFLEAQAEKGLAKPFEIFVDNLKVVAKTDDPKEFDSYEFYMNEDTEKVRILIYNSNLSPRNDQYCFMVQRTIGGKSLNGLGEIENVVQEKLAARDREYEMNRLKEELETAKEDLAETEEECDRLLKEIENLKANKFKLNGADIPAFVGSVLESMARRNPQALAKLPFGGEALAGFIQQDNKDLESRSLNQQPAAEPAVSFQKETTPEITEDEKRTLAFLKSFEKNLNGEQAQMFNLVLQAMVNEPSIIPTIHDLITTKK